MSRPIYLSTREVARLNGQRDSLPVIYAQVRRKGNYKGVVPRKGKNGRLIWSADEVRAAITPGRTAWPAGLETLSGWIRSVAPETPSEAADAIAYALLGSEWTPSWKPAPGQFEASRLKTEIGLVGMAFQALIERVDQACCEGQSPYPKAEIYWLAQIIYWQLWPSFHELKMEHERQFEAKGAAI